MKKILIAGLLAAIGTVAFVGTSQAASKYCIYNPEDPACHEMRGEGPDYQDNGRRHGNGYPGYGYDEGRGSYAGGEEFGYDGRRLHDKRLRRVGSCEAVGRTLRDYGYRRIRALECGGKNYKYVAFRGYQRYLVKVSRRSGQIFYEISY